MKSSPASNATMPSNSSSNSMPEAISVLLFQRREKKASSTVHPCTTQNSRIWATECAGLSTLTDDLNTQPCVGAADRCSTVPRLPCRACPPLSTPRACAISLSSTTRRYTACGCAGAQAAALSPSRRPPPVPPAPLVVTMCAAARTRADTARERPPAFLPPARGCRRARGGVRCASARRCCEAPPVGARMLRW